MIKRLTIEVDTASLTFEQMSKVSRPLAELEKLSKSGVILMTSVEVKGHSKPRKPRSDKLYASERAIFPQEGKILDHLRGNGQGTVPQIAASLGISENSTRGNLHSLKTKGLVSQGGGRPTIWQALPA